MARKIEEGMRNPEALNPKPVPKNPKAKAPAKKKK